jgi:mRNA interferase MazF
MNRGDIYRVVSAPNRDPKKRRFFVVVSRQTLLDSKAAHAVCAPINTEGHGLETEIQVGQEQGLKHISYINCDLLVRIEKSKLTDYVGSLAPQKLRAVNQSLRIALDLD